MGATPGGHDRFPGFDVLAQAGTWDEVTQGVVLRRLGPPPAPRFFTQQEEAVCR
ncbi:MAG TPA: gluconate 2-dehydrogenase subunit 3 family protein, partial [Actinomycetota bacterium]|nr:gluconate 2-dehydrogenase subunit 3 family protein [Actinomycetota bacterium]